MELRKEDTEHNKLEQGTLATVTGNTCKENMEQVRVLEHKKTPETGTWNVRNGTYVCYVQQNF
jgi:hypothetical protein